jgi:hypothetical protein
MTYSITITDKKDAITVDVTDEGTTTVTMTGNPHSRLHVVLAERLTPDSRPSQRGWEVLTPLCERGTAAPAEGVHYAKDGPVTRDAMPAQLFWAVLDKRHMYWNRVISLTRTADGLQVTYRAMFTETVAADKPVTYTVYKYGGEWRYRKEQ